MARIQTTIVYRMPLIITERRHIRLVLGCRTHISHARAFKLVAPVVGAPLAAESTLLHACCHDRARVPADISHSLQFINRHLRQNQSLHVARQRVETRRTRRRV
jgi:hypothetical protein